jgi:hypothetical protein
MFFDGWLLSAMHVRAEVQGPAQSSSTKEFTPLTSHEIPLKRYCIHKVATSGVVVYV